MSYQITILPSQRSVVCTEDETILSAAIAQNIPLPYGCRDGACGSCKCKKISGEVSHKNHQAGALSPSEEEEGYILTCSAYAHSDVVLEAKQVGAANAFVVRKMPARVVSLEKLSPDVMRVMLQLPANENFEYHAGQYIDLILPDGVRRSYSMGSAYQDGKTVELHIRHMPGGKFTDRVFGLLKEKEILRLEGPMGGFYLHNEEADQDKAMVFLASGTGFAPIKAILESMCALGVQRPCTLYWGGRRPHDLYLDQWLRTAILPRLPQLRYEPVVSEAAPEDAWEGRSGFVHEAVMQDFADLSQHQVYACGAPVVVEAAHRDFIQRCGLPEEQFFADAFISEREKNALKA